MDQRRRRDPLRRYHARIEKLRQTVTADEIAETIRNLTDGNKVVES
jgi:hypothetical protein